MPELSPKTMIFEAEKITGLTDFGGDEFWELFETLVRSINEEAALNEKGILRAEQRLQQRLCQRLKLFDDRKRRPEIAKQKIERPVMVAGLPRAGTTYTHALLGSDPANIAPLGWQLLYPSPPPNDPAIDHSMAVREAQALIEDQGWEKPHIKVFHDWNPLHPEECARAFELAFHSLSLIGYWDIPSYMSAMARDSAPAYELHKKVLQALQVGVEGRRWVLKSPEHTTQIDGLFKVYPDATVVMNHRDPAKVMASVVSFIRSLRALSTDHPPVPNREFTLALMQSYADAQDQLIRIRENPDMDQRFIDVHYLDLERDPLAVMERVYSRTGMIFDDRAQKSISSWVSNNRKGKHGKHRYSLADLEVTKDEVHVMFKNYIQYYNIELETER